MVRFEVVTLIRAAPRRVFEESLSVDTHMASMAASRERAVGGVTSGRMGPGDQVTWRAWHFGVAWRMTSVISAYDAPGFFVDEQVAGPFRRWRHEHRFAADGGGGTVMRDAVEFEAPLGVLGRVAESVALRRHMTALIVARNAHLKAVLESAG
ncbi:SRPBCC family protein [Nonomuraea sp. NPDC048826]|uniref:SRPBCC family protein n=1 Tax=Nonomuraea sp. NPDC048826 TaxID=3364347 RepID=UPI003715FDD5